MRQCTLFLDLSACNQTQVEIYIILMNKSDLKIGIDGAKGKHATEVGCQLATFLGVVLCMENKWY